MTSAVAGFDWDDGNREKCQSHGVSILEIEQLFALPHSVRVDAEHSLTEERLAAIGQTRTGRFVFLVFTLREGDGVRCIRPISARYMHRKEVRHYEKENPDLYE